MLNRSTDRAGFTLIELLLVMTILGLLLSIALPRYWQSLDRAKETTLKQNLKVLRSTLDQFHGDKGRYPADLEELVSNGYLRAVPVDPVTESSSTWIVIMSNDGDQPGVVDVHSGAQGSDGLGNPYESM
jgi:general secretion pathway protein G